MILPQVHNAHINVASSIENDRLTDTQKMMILGRAGPNACRGGGHRCRLSIPSPRAARGDPSAKNDELFI